MPLKWVRDALVALPQPVAVFEYEAKVPVAFNDPAIEHLRHWMPGFDLGEDPIDKVVAHLGIDIERLREQVSAVEPDPVVLDGFPGVVVGSRSPARGFPRPDVLVITAHDTDADAAIYDHKLILMALEVMETATSVRQTIDTAVSQLLTASLNLEYMVDSYNARLNDVWQKKAVPGS